MPTEADLSAELVHALKAESRKAVIFKHADRFTFAIPDISVTFHGITNWLEVKYVRKSYKELLGERNIHIQLAMIGKLGRQGCGWFVVFYGVPIHYTYVMTAGQLSGRIDDKARDYIDIQEGKNFKGICQLVFGREHELHRHGERVSREDGDSDSDQSH